MGTGTGPSHEIAKNICAEHAIMGIVTKRYDNMNQMVAQGVKTKEDMLLEDETPFELASIAVFKMFNEWEAGGYELPRSVESCLYSTNQFVPVKQRLGWIRGSNLGFTTPLNGTGPNMVFSIGTNITGSPTAALGQTRRRLRRIAPRTYCLSSTALTCHKNEKSLSLNFHSFTHQTCTSEYCSMYKTLKVLIKCLDVIKF